MESEFGGRAGEGQSRRAQRGPYQGVIFDVDGTLVDSNHAHAQAWGEAFERSGHPVAYERIRALIGMGGDKLIPAASGLSAEGPEGRAIAKDCSGIFRARYLPSLRPFPCARELLQALKDRGLRLAVASSAEREELEPLLRIAGVQDLVEWKASGNDAERSKPDPDIVAVALSRLRCRSEEAVMIGDTPYDIHAAQRAGVACIAFRCGGWNDEALSGAIALYDGPWSALTLLETSVLGSAH